ncbi:MAG TPA: translation initiation factor IF-3 [Candidatus Kapabacteria bacterium]|nr:translation initiation factor IF-3 [Candidatus Kapabacteria bacterium]
MKTIQTTTLPSNTRKNRVNDEIIAKEVRLIDETGKMIGVVPILQALRIAEEKDLDLVEISPNANPPVCKILDYRKFIYEQQKREKTQRKQQSSQEMKELRFTWRTADHDFNFKVRHAREFLEEGNKVKATVMFRGREIAHREVGEELLNKFVESLSDIAKIDTPVKLDGKRMSVILALDKSKVKKSQKTEIS